MQSGTHVDADHHGTTVAMAINSRSPTRRRSSGSDKMRATVNCASSMSSREPPPISRRFCACCRFRLAAIHRAGSSTQRRTYRSRSAGKMPITNIYRHDEVPSRFSNSQMPAAKSKPTP